MSLRLQAACWLLSLTVIGGYGCAQKSESAAAPPTQREVAASRPVPEDVVAEPQPVVVEEPAPEVAAPPLLGFPASPETSNVPTPALPALQPPALPLPTAVAGSGEPRIPADGSAKPYSAQRPTNDYASPAAPSTTGNDRPGPRFIERAPSQFIPAPPPRIPETNGASDSQVPYGGFSAPRNFARQPAWEDGAAVAPQEDQLIASSTTPSLPPIRSLESLPRPSNSSAARFAIADSSRASEPESYEPSGGSAPPPDYAVEVRSAPYSPSLTLRQEIEEVAPPFPDLAEPPPAAAFVVPPPEAEPVAVPEKSHQRFVPQMNFGMSTAPLIDTAPAAAPQPAVVSPPRTDYSIAPLVAPASERMKGDHEVVEVFYGTDRYADNADGEAPWVIFMRFIPALCCVLVTTLLFGLTLQRPRIVMWGATISSAAAALVFVLYAGSVTNSQARALAKQGPVFGTHRGELQTGICRVSIPRVHKVGALEAPSILKFEVREDVKRHVILQETIALHDEAFYTRLRKRLNQSANRELFIFIHGYNVSFEDAARRAAQMHYDLDYAGAPIFYSWPSQGELWKYTVDETNVAWTAPHLKQFVRDIVAHSGARSINLIAHSMGNRAMTSALRDIALEMRDEEKLFNQVVLAAPDIDAEVFKRDIAPLIQRTAENVTLYASSHDQALMASKLVHGYPRAGESGRNLVVLQGIDTIDVSSVETNFLGHSYYGDSDVILADVCRLLTDSPPPQERHWLIPAVAANGQMTYWVFQGAQAAAGMPRAMR